MNRWLIMLAMAALLAGCKDDAECERERMTLNKAWSELRTAATHRKLEGSDVPTWSQIENKAELLESSFMTRQVTWNSARKASQEIASKLPALESSGDARLVGFTSSAEKAIKRQNSFEKQCR